jgi:surface-anchored protein
MHTQNNFIRIFLLVSACVVSAANAERCISNTSSVTTLYFRVEIDLPCPEHPHTIPAAHTDIQIPLTFDEGWDIYIHTELPVPETRVETEDALFAMTASHRSLFSGSVPSAYRFIGAQAGETFWYYNQSQAPAPGFNSEDMGDMERGELCLWDPNDPVRNAAGTQKWLQVNLVDVRGPEGGEVSMWRDISGAPVVFFSTLAGGITDEDVFYIQAGRHSHNSWAFTRPGLYEVDIQVKTWHLCDESLTADINNDCRVDLADLAFIAGQWLACGSDFTCLQ